MHDQEQQCDTRQPRHTTLPNTKTLMGNISGWCVLQVWHDIYHRLALRDVWDWVPGKGNTTTARAESTLYLYTLCIAVFPISVQNNLSSKYIIKLLAAYVSNQNMF